MEELFTNYTVSEIILFLIALAAAVKGFFTFWDWAIDRLKRVFQKDFEEKDFDKKLLTQLEDIKNQMKNIRTGHVEDKQDIISQIQGINVQHAKDKQELIDKMEETKKTMSILLASDKDDIKSWITEKHHYFCYEKKVIDDYSLDCIEKRYQHYVDEGGNSYVATLMREIRALPKVSMLKEHDKDEYRK